MFLYCFSASVPTSTNLLYRDDPTWLLWRWMGGGGRTLGPCSRRQRAAAAGWRSWCPLSDRSGADHQGAPPWTSTEAERTTETVNVAATATLDKRLGSMETLEGLCFQNLYLDVVLRLLGQDVSGELVVVYVSLNSRVFLPWEKKTIKNWSLNLLFISSTAPWK